jgi:hypothetical protein
MNDGLRLQKQSVSVGRSYSVEQLSEALRLITLRSLVQIQPLHPI